MGKKWNRKRKAQEKNDKANRPRKDKRDNNKNGKGSYNIVQYSNAKFESYYSLIGLHNTKLDTTNNNTFVPCNTDEEKHTERNLFISTMSQILPASFRVDRSLDSTIQTKVLNELQEFVGKEMELEVELPTRSVVFGGIKNILDNGKDKKIDSVEKEQVDGEKKEEDTTETKPPASEKKKNDYNPIIVKKTIAPAKPIPFISSGTTTLGYQLAIDRRTLRRNKSLEPLHEWLKIQVCIMCYSSYHMYA